MLNTWAELGNTGWDWDIMGPYYTKAFTLPQTPDELRTSLGVDSWGSDNQDTSGPIRLSYPGDSSHPIRKLWAETFKKKGYLMAANPWARASVGVKYRHNGEERMANVSKEVVISAGALQSPKLLELSGIGNPDLLNQYDIKVLNELPGVGGNLQDHLICGIQFAAVDELETLDALVRQEPQAMGDAMLRYTHHRDGLLTSSGIMTYAYLPIIDFLSGPGREKLVKLLEENRPAVSLTAESERAQKYYEIAENMLLDPNQASGAYLSASSQNPIAPDPQTGTQTPPPPPKRGKYLTIASILAQPLSRGAVHIASKDSTQAPIVDPKYLSYPLDAEVFARHIKYIETIASSAPLSSIILKQPQPQPLDLDAAKRYIASHAISMWHPAGTCAMLPEQIGGVVDPGLRVYGVANLRVVGASVVPLLPPGNLQSTVYAIAERAADLINSSYGWGVK